MCCVRHDVHTAMLCAVTSTTTQGAFVSATIVERAPRTSKLVAEEAFGPAMVIEPYDTFEHAIQLANDRLVCARGTVSVRC
jgi:acyl-CoA reductase-like NAD-dependent aldehyde dehydrogenase